MVGRALSGQRLRMSTAEAATTKASKASKVQGSTDVEELPTNESSASLLRIRHTTSHVMAMAVQKLFPGTQVTIGPWIDNG